MEKPNQLPKTQGCSAGGVTVESLPERTTGEKRTQGKARAASRRRILLKQFSLERKLNANGDGVKKSVPETETSGMVSWSRVCRGLRAWRVLKETHGTKEARRVPAALTARAKQEGRRNDKKRRLMIRESDWFIVSSGKAPAPRLEKGPTAWRSPHRQPVPVRATGLDWPTFLWAKTTCQVEEPGAGKPPAGICEGGTGQPVSLPRHCRRANRE